jgi:hypothetical protein
MSLRFVGGQIGKAPALGICGTFWSEDEMTSLSLSKRNAPEMGHVQLRRRVEWHLGWGAIPFDSLHSRRYLRNSASFASATEKWEVLSDFQTSLPAAQALA